jgi:hypothetical protein
LSIAVLAQATSDVTCVSFFFNAVVTVTVRFQSSPLLGGTMVVVVVLLLSLV